jgi:carbon-monoxide dehydrogenase medium subunit
MKPVVFEHVRVASVAEAAAALAANADNAKVVAGCQSLGPMLNLRLAQPQLLIDVTGIAELTNVTSEPDALVIGACVTHADIEDGRVAADGASMLPAVAGAIAYRAVRNRGTIGGSLCHADPAADWINALSTLGAGCVISDGTNERRVPVAQFMTSAFEVALQPGELLTAVRVPRCSSGTRWGYYKVCRKPGEFALAIGAVLSDPERGLFRAVIGATQGTPIIIDYAHELFDSAPGVRGCRLDESAAARLLQERGITSPVAQRPYLTALQRAATRAA